MEKINTDYKRRTRKHLGLKFSRCANHDVAHSRFKDLKRARRPRIGQSLYRISHVLQSPSTRPSGSHSLILRSSFISVIFVNCLYLSLYVVLPILFIALVYLITSYALFLSKHSSHWTLWCKSSINDITAPTKLTAIHKHFSTQALLLLLIDSSWGPRKPHSWRWNSTKHRKRFKLQRHLCLNLMASSSAGQDRYDTICWRWILILP